MVYRTEFIVLIVACRCKCRGNIDGPIITHVDVLICGGIPTTSVAHYDQGGCILPRISVSMDGVNVAGSGVIAKIPPGIGDHRGMVVIIDLGVDQIDTVRELGECGDWFRPYVYHLVSGDGGITPID